jgi:hypothetical protein
MMRGSQGQGISAYAPWFRVHFICILLRPLSSGSFAAKQKVVLQGKSLVHEGRELVDNVTFELLVGGAQVLNHTRQMFFILSQTRHLRFHHLQPPRIE